MTKAAAEVHGRHRPRRRGVSRFAFTVALLCVVILSTVTPTASQNVIVVGQGSSSVPTLQRAIDLAVDGDQIIVAPGIYTGVENRGLQICRDTVITSETGNREDVVFDCGQLGRLFSLQPGVSLALVSVTVTNCRASTGGVGMAHSTSELFVQDCAFYDNYADNSGGVFAMGDFTKLVVNGTKFAGNCAVMAGAAVIGGFDSSVLVTESTFTNHTSISGTLVCNQCNMSVIDTFASQGSHNFIKFQSSDPSLVLFVNNVEVNDYSSLDLVTPGAGILVSGGLAFISNSHMYNLESSTGPAISFFGQSGGSVTGCHFENTRAVVDYGGAIIDYSSFYPLNIIGNTFKNATTPYAGGAILSSADFPDKQILIAGNTFKNCRAREGGAVFMAQRGSADVKITNCTFINNESTENGMALALLGFVDQSRPTYVLDDLRVIGNTGPSGALMIWRNAAANISNSIFEDNSADSGAALLVGFGLARFLGDHVFLQNNHAENNGGAIVVAAEGRVEGMDVVHIKHNRAATGGGGAVYFRWGDVAEGGGDVDCRRCKNNKAAYGDVYATMGLELRIKENIPKRMSSLDELGATLSVHDAYGQVTTGTPLTFFIDVSPSDAISVDLSKGSRADALPLMFVITDEKAEFVFTIAGEFEIEHVLTFAVVEAPWLGNHSFTIRINDCGSDEYLKSYPPGVGLAQVCDEVDYVYTSDTRRVMQIVFGVLTGIGILATLAVVAVVIRYRSSSVITLSSPLFCVLILIGIFLGYLTTVWFLLQPEDWVCILRPIFLIAAFTMSFGPLVVKNYRIWRLFENDGYSPHIITNLSLLAAMSVYVCVNTGLIIVWMALSAPHAKWAYDDDTDDEKVRECDIGVGAVALTISSLSFLVLLAATFLAFRTRTVSKRFNESRWIALTVYTCLFVLVMFIPLIIWSDDPDFEMVLWVCGIWVCTTVLLFGLFSPKLLALAAETSGGTGDTAADRSKHKNSEGAKRSSWQMTEMAGGSIYTQDPAADSSEPHEDQSADRTAFGTTSSDDGAAAVRAVGGAGLAVGQFSTHSGTLSDTTDEDLNRGGRTGGDLTSSSGGRRAKVKWWQRIVGVEEEETHGVGGVNRHRRSANFSAAGSGTGAVTTGATTTGARRPATVERRQIGHAGSRLQTLAQHANSVSYDPYGTNTGEDPSNEERFI
eukprot:TRINITY_DN724_c0_g3_i1.p1 TRINITY_DN724_c0_g3~~TRINITY_DN724_c0_g3_i1.p1  ORF type:complete len:1174 (+),score=174.43 TRINITY_DN724_c0_g3_i1:308-3829(+)